MFKKKFVMINEWNGIKLFLLCIHLLICQRDCGRIDVDSASNVKNVSFIDFYLESYQIGLFSSMSVLDMFQERSIRPGIIKSFLKDKNWPSDSSQRGIMSFCT